MRDSAGATPWRAWAPRAPWLADRSRPAGRPGRKAEKPAPAGPITRARRTRTSQQPWQRMVPEACAGVAKSPVIILVWHASKRGTRMSIETQVQELLKRIEALEGQAREIGR